MKFSFSKKLLLLFIVLTSQSLLISDEPENPLSDDTSNKTEHIALPANKDSEASSEKLQEADPQDDVDEGELDPDDAALFADDEQTEQTNAQIVDQQEKQKNQEFFEKVAAHLATYLEHLESIVQQMALIVNSNQIRKVNKTKAIQQLFGLKNDITLARQQLEQQPINSQTVLILLSYSQVITKYVEDVISSNLKKFPDIQKYVGLMQKRSAALATMKPHQIKKVVITLKHKAKELEKKAESVGISFFNKTYRRIEQFMNTWKVSKRIKQALIISVFLYATLPPHEVLDASEAAKSALGGAYSPKTSPLYKMPYGIGKVFSHIKKFFGGRPHQNFQTPNFPFPPNNVNFKLMGLLEYTSMQIGIGQFRFSNPLFDLTAIGMLMQDEAIEGYRWLLDKTSRVTSFLRGGPQMVTEMRFLKEPRHTLDDVIGREDAKQYASHIVDYILNPTRYDRAGTTPEKGYLLAGPTRSGKTFFAEAIAGTIRVTLKAHGIDRFSFISLSAADVLKYGVKDIIDFALQNAPCVLFVDEFDMLGVQRERNAELLATLLTQLSGAMNDDLSKIILIAATNLPEHIDGALLQKGRIGETLWFYYPTYEERFEFIKRKLNRWITTVEDQYIAQLARETHGRSFAVLESLLEKAKLYADQKKKAIDAVEIERAFDRVVRNIIDEPIPVSENDKRLYAVHNGAKALVSVLLETNEQLSKVTIKRVETTVAEKPLWARYDEQTANAIEKRKETFGKAFTFLSSVQRSEKNRDDYIAEIKILLAGHMAEKMIFGAKAVDYNPYDEAIALAMCRFLIYKGTKEEFLPKDVRQKLDGKALKLMKTCKQEVKEILAAHHKDLERMVEKLVERETLNANEVRTFIKQNPTIVPERSSATAPDTNLEAVA